VALMLPFHSLSWYSQALSTTLFAPPNLSSPVRGPAELLRYLASFAELGLVAVMGVSALLDPAMHRSPLRWSTGAALLVAMGARIEGVGTGRLEIEGVSELGGATHRIVPDRIEAGTLLVAGAITRGDVRVTDMAPEHLTAVLAKLEECGVALEMDPTWARVRADARPRPADIVTSPFPGFPTDMQAQLMTLLGLADGQSRVTETIFENRFMHAAELARMGASITTDGAIAVIRGVEAYQGAPVMASDLRASAALVLAGLAARGRTEVARIYHLDRGYERLESKLTALGARIERRP